MSERGHTPLECRVNDDIFSPEKIQLSRINVNFYRVGHDLHTWEACRPQVEDMVKSNSDIILERAPMCEGIVDKNGVVSKDAIATVLEAERLDSGEELDPNDPDVISIVQKHIDRNLASSFFAKVEDCAAKLGKRVVLIDPYYIKTENQLVQFDDRVDTTKKLLGLGGLVGTFLVDKLTKEAELKKDKSVEAQPLSRRRFLQRSVGLAASLVPGLSHRPALDDRSHNVTDFLPNLVSYDLNDYRNVVISEGLSQLDGRLEAGTSVGAIYGGAHGPAVKDYVLSPNERAVRMAAYAPFKSVAKPHVRIFEFKDKSWSQVDEWDL